VLGVNMFLPINYQYEFSSWVYKTIHLGNPKFAECLHSLEYNDSKKTIYYPNPVNVGVKKQDHQVPI